MTRIKNNIRFFIFIALNIAFFFIFQNLIDFSKIMAMNNDFHFNMISAASIIGGFIFTGLGIFLGALDKERINRIWEHHYLDNYYRKSILGIIYNVITIIIAIILLCFSIPANIITILTTIELTTIVSGLLCFTLGIKDLSLIFKLLKQRDHN